jgi:hypothetical protein
MNIYQKLIEVRKSCEYLKKDTQGDRFKFVSSSQTLCTLRGAMDEHGLLLVPSVTGHEVRRHENNTYKPEDIPKKQYFTILDMTFTWVNAEKPDETVVCQWTGHGLDDAEKGVGKAVTYAEKYVLLKFFNIATDKDDPDSFQKEPDQGRPFKPAADPTGKLKFCKTIDELKKVFSALSQSDQKKYEKVKDDMKIQIVKAQMS